MSKKEKAAFALAENFQAITTVIPKLEALIKVHKEIASSYQKYRKSGGAAISGIEKHLGIKEVTNTPSSKKKEIATATKTKAPKESSETKKTIKKDKK
jgi:hypothetical protein